MNTPSSSIQGSDVGTLSVFQLYDQPQRKTVFSFSTTLYNSDCMTMERIGEMGARTSSIGSKFDSGTYWWCKRTENWGTEPHSALTVILLWTLVLKFHYQNYLCMENHDPYLRLYVSRTEWRKRSYLGSLPFIGENELTNQHMYCSDPSVSIPPHLQAETKGLIVSDWIPLFGVECA